MGAEPSEQNFAWLLDVQERVMREEYRRSLD